MEDREIVELLQALVRAESHPRIERQEEKAAQVLDAFLRAHAIHSTLAEVRPGRPNLTASLSGQRPGRHLILCGHLDTVSPNDEAGGDAFSARIEEGRLFGRGSADMKGALAAMAGALALLKESGAPAAGRVTLAAVIDEEEASLGAEALINSGLRADGAVVGEPTSNRVALGHKGLEWIAVDFEGRAAHSSTPEAGVNAVAAAAHFITLAERELGPAFERRRDPVLGLPTINIAVVRGGQQPSFVPAHCRVELDRRWVKTETVDDVLADLEALLERVRAARPGLKTKLERMPSANPSLPHGPLVIDPGHPLVGAALAAFDDLGLPCPETTVFPAWTDGALLSNLAGIPTVIWGPGDVALAHSADESVPIAEVLQAARLYAAAARRFTSA